MQIRKTIYRRSIPVALSAAIAAGALATPQQAKAVGTGDFLVGMGVSLISMGISELIGTAQGDLKISRASLEDIEELIDASISEAFFNYHMATANAAIDEAELYACSADETSSQCAAQAEDVFYAVNSAASHLEMTDLPGVTYYGMMTALGIAFLKEWRSHELATGDTEQVAVIDAKLDDKTFDADYLRSKRDEWNMIEFEHRAFLRNGFSGFMADGELLPRSQVTSSGNYFYYDLNYEPHYFPYDCYGACSYPIQSERDAAYQEALASWEGMFEDTRDEVLGTEFQQLVDEIEFVGTGESIDGTSTELFCELYDGETIRMRAMGLFHVNVGFFPMYPFPDTLTEYVVDCVSDDSEIRMVSSGGEFLRVLHDGNLDHGGSGGDLTRWTAWMQDNGTWAFRGWNGTYMDAMGTEPLFGLPAFQFGQFSGFGMVDFAYPSGMFTIDVV